MAVHTSTLGLKRTACRSNLEAGRVSAEHANVTRIIPRQREACSWNGYLAALTSLALGKLSLLYLEGAESPPGRQLMML